MPTTEDKMTEYVMVRLTRSEKREAVKRARKARLGLARWFKEGRATELGLLAQSVTAGRIKPHSHG